MNKKWISLALVVLMAVSTLVSASAEHFKVAEDFAKFDVEMDIPEGATAKQAEEEGWVCVQISFADQTGPVFDMNIAPAEDQGDKSMADLTAEEKELQKALIGENFSIPEFEFFTTPSGNEILLTKETDPNAGSVVSMDTLYKGFSFNLTMNNADFSALTDEEMQMMHTLLESVQINPVDAPAA